MNKLEVLQKVIYFCVLTISLSIFIRQVVSCLTRYFNFDTSISLDVQSTGITEFPAFTVCPDFNAAYKGGLLDTCGLTVAQIRHMQFPSNLKMSSEDFFELVTYELEELVANVYVKTNSKLSLSYSTKKVVPFKTSTLYHNIAVRKMSRSKQIYLFNQVYPYILFFHVE
jgi:hypothetical protein